MLKIYKAKREIYLVQSVTSKTLEENIPKHLRDEDGKWFAITKELNFLFTIQKQLIKRLRWLFLVLQNQI